MYQYDDFDQKLVDERVEQFRDQVERRLSGELTEDEFKPLRLMNGVYLQLHAYMMRVAIPYGLLNSKQLHKLGDIADKYDKGYAHFTTRQNIQYNWPKLEEIPDLLADLASVQMHANQTSGNCIRNTTSDQYAGAAADEIEDPRIYCEIIRQWSTFHPEFAFLPRKFKIAVTGSPNDRAAVRVHDIGILMKKDADGNTGFEIIVGGGLGRTPMIGKTINEFIPKGDLLSYLEAILRVYNLYGRRDNKYKARIKILVHEEGIDEIRKRVEEEFAYIRNGVLDLPQEEIDRITNHFAPPAYETLGDTSNDFEAKKADDQRFRIWAETNLADHKMPGYAIVNLSLKPIGGAPGDASTAQLHAMADLAERYSFDQAVVTHEQNIVFANVKQSDLYDLWQALDEMELATPNIGKLSDMICCPGMDYCALATARSIPVAQDIALHFAKLGNEQDIGDIKVKISGCINACGHHHVGNIGILGVDKRGEEFYQITLGGTATEDAAVGKIVGRAFALDEIIGAIDTIVSTYLGIRNGSQETFLETVNRVGMDPFKEKLYGAN